MKDKLLAQVKAVEKIASMSKIARMLHNPAKYIFAILYRLTAYRLLKKEVLVKAKLFYGKTMLVALPAATDIYLTGGKSHISEIRLTKYLIKHLDENAVFIDIGAHYGFFTLLANEMITSGKVYAFEPSGKTFAILQSNTAATQKIQILNKAVTSKNMLLEFYEFDNLHSEYNTFNASQFEHEAWFKNNTPVLNTVEAVSVDEFCKTEKVKPDFIKIDAEGFENEVIKGSQKILTEETGKPIIIMEYVEPIRNNQPHREAYNLLHNWGYQSFVIDNNGNPIPQNNIDHYLTSNKLESDNIVFMASSL
ncbi:FkbM family methyltransferase [Sphingobacteriales bacterium UPWRP_1]|nr:hypothetical protein B6N25_00515 [Sphingobacteriales bacterium TSM_CSS]PSJ71931.1 FkbM family methyltransferase [Sphingobacteriales bacterium UPWRP_1]